MEAILELSYALDTFYFLVSGALVMWMAAGFAMLEAGMVRAKNTAEIRITHQGQTQTLPTIPQGDATWLWLQGGGETTPQQITFK